jgi:hypothetical protein
MPEICYSESVEKEILNEGGNPAKISSEGSTELKKIGAVDVREAQKNGESKKKWKPFLKKENVFTTDQKAVIVEFEITIPVKKELCNAEQRYMSSIRKQMKLLNLRMKKEKTKLQHVKNKSSGK